MTVAREEGWGGGFHTAAFPKDGTPPRLAASTCVRAKERETVCVQKIDKRHRPLLFTQVVDPVLVVCSQAPQSDRRCLTERTTYARSTQEARETCLGILAKLDAKNILLRPHGHLLHDDLAQVTPHQQPQHYSECNQSGGEGRGKETCHVRGETTIQKERSQHSSMPAYIGIFGLEPPLIF